MTYSSIEATGIPGQRISAPRFVLGALFCWAIAVLGCHVALLAFGGDAFVFGVRVVAILASGALLGKLSERLDTRAALSVGVAWAALAIGTEIVLTAQSISGWYELLGNPVSSSDWMRGTTVIAWLLAPGMAARASE